MENILVKLFGTPIVYKNGKQVSFRFKKAEALFYYLLANKQATRDQLVYMFWGEEEEETAKKNLRNALYNIRKAFELEIVLSPQKSKVMLNTDINIECDLFNLLRQASESIYSCQGEFLQGFYVKGCEGFEEWLQSTREHCKGMYTALLYNQIDVNIRENRVEGVEQLARLLVTADHYEERAYRILINNCIKAGTYNKGIDYYKKLAEILHKELGIEPDPETQRLYRELLKEKSLSDNEESGGASEKLFGRSQEIKQLRQHYKSFIAEAEYKSIVICGEAGIGKTRLKEHFINEIAGEEAYVFQSNCYQAEEGFYLRPWNGVFVRLADIINRGALIIPRSWKNVLAFISPVFDFDGSEIGGRHIDRLEPIQYQLVEEVLLGVLRKLGESKKVIIVFEDIHWMDAMSLSLLNCFILHQKINKLFFIATSRNEYHERLDNTLSALQKYSYLERVDLNRFSMEEVRGFIAKSLPNFELTQEAVEYIYKETEGNSFFLIEYINAVKEKRNCREMSNNMQEVIKSRFLGISPEGRKILNLMSISFDNISLELLKELLNMDELSLITYTEELINKRIINEGIDENQVSYSFSHQKLREYIYQQQSNAMKRLLHNRLGELLERQLKQDASDHWLYSKLIYHFFNGGNYLLALKYHIRNADLYLDYTHELFPILVDSPQLKEKNLYLPKEQALRYINEAEALITKAKGSCLPSEELKRLELYYYLIKGRYLIKEGEYEPGVEVIRKMIQESSELGEDFYTLKAYRQMIYYSIQTHNVELMEEFVDKSFGLAKKNNYQKEFGLLLRLQGVSRIMLGQYEEAEELLKQALQTFTALNRQEDKYASNIAAIHNYLGEIRRYCMKFSGALSFYDEAIDICKRKGFLRGLTIFNTNAGRTAFEMGDYVRAKQYFRNALLYYNQYDIAWGRPVAEAYMALLLIGDGEYREAYNCLRRADDLSNRLKSPYELGLTYRIKADIKARMNTNKALENFFKDYLADSIGVYCQNGIQLLSRVRESYEVEILKVLQKCEN